MKERVKIQNKNKTTHVWSSTSGLIYRLVPTRGLLATFISPVVCVWVTARPKSAMTHMPFERTRMFLLLMSRWAMAGLPYVYGRIKVIVY